MKKNLLKHMKIIHKVTDIEEIALEEKKPKVMVNYKTFIFILKLFKNWMGLCRCTWPLVLR